MASRAVLAAHSSMLASTMTGEASNNEQEVLLPEASLDQLSPLLSVLHGLQIDQVDQQCANKLLLDLSQDWTDDIIQLAVLLGLDAVLALAAADKMVSNSDSCLNVTCKPSKDTIHSMAESFEQS